MTTISQTIPSSYFSQPFSLLNHEEKFTQSRQEAKSHSQKLFVPLRRSVFALNPFLSSKIPFDLKRALGLRGDNLMLGNRNRAAEANIDVRAWVGWAVTILPTVYDLAIV